MSSNYVTVTGGRGEYRSIPFRYVWPSELDLMARLAGMRLRDRWEDWSRAAVHQREPPARLGLGEGLRTATRSQFGLRFSRKARIPSCASGSWLVAAMTSMA